MYLRPKVKIANSCYFSKDKGIDKLNFFWRNVLLKEIHPHVKKIMIKIELKLYQCLDPNSLSYHCIARRNVYKIL